MLILTACGCGSGPQPPVDTGARAAAQGYYEALVHQDWAGAYHLLHPDSRGRFSLTQFTSLARAYRQNLGFEPVGLQVRSCEEHGAEATVHVVLTGRTTSQARRYKDALVLRATKTGWGVILSQRFGQPQR